MFWADQFNEDRICLLTMEGTVSRSDLANLAERLRGLAAQNVPQIVIDARRVDHWDYRGLGTTAEAVRSCGRGGTRVAFVTPSRYLRDIVAAAGLNGAFDFYDALELEGAPVKLELVEVPRPMEVRPLRRATGL